MSEDILREATVFLNSIYPLSEKEMQRLFSAFELKSYKKNDCFIRSGQHCLHAGFLITGIARVSHFYEDKEYTSYFNFPKRNRIVCSFESFLTGKPSQEDIQFLQNSELMMITKTELEKLYTESESFVHFGRRLAELNYLLALKRIFSLQHDPAIERYKNLLDIYPNLMNEVPHHYIASYLGITPESLSRIRKQV